LLKQTASYIVTRGSSVHAVFLDASKAFDRVLHMKLFEKLIQRKVPMCFVRLLKHWYKEQTIQIKWGKHFSKLFHVSNGVRQGGVLSPHLFAVYVNQWSPTFLSLRTCLHLIILPWPTEGEGETQIVFNLLVLEHAFKIKLVAPKNEY